MSDQIDDRLKRWIEATIDGAAVSLSAPDAQRSGEGVGLYLLEVLQSSAMSTLKPPPLQLTLRYLVTTWSEQMENAHAALTRLFFAAMESTDFEVERTPPPVELWRAFGVRPQPAFVLRAPLLQERPHTPAKLVRQPVRVEMVSRVAFFGRVLGPEDVPIANCFVEVPALGLSTRSDYEGHFAFAGLPAGRATAFVLRARGQEMSVSSDQNFADRRTPMIFRFGSMED